MLQTKSTVGVIGLGYVGLPSALRASSVGYVVRGFDISSSVVQSLMAGRSHVDDISDEDVREAFREGFTVTTDFSLLGECDVVCITVPTPLGEDGGPDLTAVLAATASVREFMRAGVLVILESTTWPGTTEELILPELESGNRKVGEDFFLAYAPERIDPGNRLFTVANTPKVVGGVTSACAQVAEEFYGQLVNQVVLAKSPREAEMAKLLENTYRHVNIALVNEMARFSHDLGIDIWDVIRCAATKPFGFQSFSPGPGVGGHCIPIDPNYLSHHVKARLGYPFRFVELAQEINAGMPRYVVSRLQDLLNSDGKPLQGSRVILLGVSYKAGIKDERESPAPLVAALLLERGAEIDFWDPLIDVWSALDGKPRQRKCTLEDAVQGADAVVILQSDSCYDALVRMDIGARILDTRGTLTGSRVSVL